MLKRTKLCTSLMVAFGSGVVAVPAFAQQTTPPAPQQLERVEITGSSIKRIDAETALPVQIITREQIRKTGAVNMEQLLQTISSISSSGGLTAASASGATTGGISSVSIHGLTSLRTLVLLNGRRVAPYGIGFSGDSVSVDVNSIPLAAIERVEVLKDGASAVYGSDAIAGVINFILRSDFKGVEATAEYGDTTQGGGKFKRVTGAFGFGDLSRDRYNVMVVASYQKENFLFGRDRDFARSGINVRNLNDTSSGNTFPANVYPLNPNDTDGTSNPSAPGCPSPYAINDPLFGSDVLCRFDPSPLVTLIPESDRTSIFASGKFALTSSIELFGEASYNRNKIRTVIQPVPLSDQFTIPANNPLCAQAPYNTASPGDCVSAIVLTPASAFYPTALANAQYGGTPDLLVRYRSAVTGNRDFTDISEAPRFVAGIRGSAAGWDFNVAGLYSESKVREQVNAGYPAYTQIMPLLNSGNVNFFGPNTADVDAALRATGYTGDAYTIKSSLTSIAARASRDVLTLPAGPLAIAFGAEGRREKYNFSASPEIQAGDISGYGGNFLPIDKTRDVTALFGEATIPIVKNLEANVAVRYDHYQGVGNSLNPKGSLRWQPIPQLLLRTSYGKGFRAPSLQDLFAPNTQSVTTQGLSDPLRCSPPLPAGTQPGGQNNSNDCQTQFTTTFGGNDQLKPEKSRNFTLGAVIEPVANVTLGIDYFRVVLKDTIVNGVDAPTILGDPTAYAALIQRGPANPSQPGFPGPITGILQTNLNLGTTKVSGFDFDAKWRIPAGDVGRFTITGNAAYFRQFDTSNLDGSYTGGVDVSNASTGGVVPRFRSYLSVDWSRGPFSLTLAQIFQKGYNDLPGTFEDTSDPAFQPRHVKSYATYDLQGSYEAFKSWRFTLGAKNLFNTDPPYTNAGGQTAFQAGYDPQYADARGRFIYGRVTYMFE